MTELRAEVLTITPEMAASLLDDPERPRNRPIRPSAVERYIHDLRNDRWRLNGEAIKLTAPLDEGGHLTDGQHRLRAIVETQKPVQSLVVYGVDAEAYVTLDRGQRRSNAEFLTINGYTDTNNLAAAAAQLIVFEESQTFQQKKVERYPDPVEVLAFVQSHEKLSEYVRRAHTIRAGHWGVPVSTLAVLMYLFYEQSPEDADVFFGRLRTGVDLEEGDPILVLRNRLANTTNLKRRLPRDEFAAIIIKAWNAFRRGECVNTLSFRAGGARPEKMPEIA